MANSLASAGATVEPSEYAALAQDEHFTGIWTQRNPLRDADVPWIYRKYYGASRFDSILDGINREITARLTDARRPGSSVYNSQSFPPGYSFYAWKWVQNNQEVIRLIYDGQDGTVYDATASQKAALFTKSSASARARFLTVGATLYWGDGQKNGKVVNSAKTWQPNTVYNPGDYIIDPNGNIQQTMGAQTGNITKIQVTSVGSQLLASIQLSASTPVTIANLSYLHFAGLTTAPVLNGQAIQVRVDSPTQFHWYTSTSSGLIPTPLQPETGTVTTSTSGASGPTPPIWQTGFGAITNDGLGNLQWMNMGPASQGFGVDAPTAAPTVSLTDAPSINPPLAVSTWYAPNSFVIKDGAGNLERVVQGGTTASASGEPAWAPVGGTTIDGSVQWFNLGPGNWQASHAYAVNDVIQATYTYVISSWQWQPDGHGGFMQVLVYTTVSTTSAFQCTVAGTSGTTQPSWNNGINTVTKEPSGLTWQNVGPAPGYPGSSQKISTATTVVDPAGYLQKPTRLGMTGATPPAAGYATTTGATTADGNQIWINVGPFSAAASQPWRWAYSGKNSITGEISNPSPISIPLIPGPNQVPVIQGPGLAGFDTIVLWRTAAGGSTLIYDDEFPNPGASQVWIYTDTNRDPALDTAIPAPGATGGATLATPPPATATAPEYHCGRIWMINGSYVIYSGGSDTVTGNGNTAFPPNNYFQLPEQPMRLKSITMQGGGLLVFCIANIYVILGDGTGSPPFAAPRMYLENVGIMAYDALCMVGSTFYGMSNKLKAFSIDPGSGYLEIGFPVGDQFKRVTTGGIDAALYNPLTTYVTWHEKDSTDTGLYVSDSAVGWFRWSAIAPPESGSLWSPRAAIVGGTSAVQSVEIAPGIFELLIAPHATGPILKRDPAVFGDWSAGAYQGYPSWDVKGSIGLCETGEVAEVAHIALKSAAVGVRPVVSLLLDEIKAGVTVEGRTTAWDQLNLEDGHHEDPPNLESSITMYSDRYQSSSTAQCPKCETFLLKVDYGTQQVADELLKFAVYGAVYKEKRQS